MPERAVLGPWVLVIVMVRVVLASWVTGKTSQAPWLKSLDSAVVWLPTVIASRRPWESQSRA
jgi:hypothetical protein